MSVCAVLLYTADDPQISCLLPLLLLKHLEKVLGDAKVATDCDFVLRSLNRTEQNREQSKREIFPGSVLYW